VNFYLGTHHATPRWWDSGVPLFVSRRILTGRQTLPAATTGWALDSGGFTELTMYGRWRTDDTQYIQDVLRFQREIGMLEWVAPQDWMCEPFIVAKTGGTVSVHQKLTVENFLHLRDQLGTLVIPVLQGWTRDDYHNCWGLYEHMGVDLEDEPLVGLGSICRRQNMSEAETIVRSLQPLRLHGFGVKTEGLNSFGDALASADSMAWSFEARRLKRRYDRQDPLFEWPKQMLCGDMHPHPHKAKSCSNCLPWALRWRAALLKKEPLCAAA
jgi:hypothetical protein